MRNEVHKRFCTAASPHVKYVAAVPVRNETSEIDTGRVVNVANTLHTRTSDTVYVVMYPDTVITVSAFLNHISHRYSVVNFALPCSFFVTKLINFIHQ